jgi:hypothetical protein
MNVAHLIILAMLTRGGGPADAGAQASPPQAEAAENKSEGQGGWERPLKTSADALGHIAKLAPEKPPALKETVENLDGLSKFLGELPAPRPREQFTAARPEPLETRLREARDWLNVFPMAAEPGLADAAEPPEPARPSAASLLRRRAGQAPVLLAVSAAAPSPRN